MTPERRNDNPERGNETMKRPTWYAARLAGQGFDIVDEATGRSIGIVRGNHDDDEASRRALLAAAAPQLLAELTEAYRALRHAAQESRGKVRAEIVGGWEWTADSARDAILVAGGRP